MPERKRVVGERRGKRLESAQKRPVIGITATSAAVPQVELSYGVERLEAQGFEVRVHPHVAKQYRFFAGTDLERATALLEWARDPEIDIVWCARGGSGAARVMEIVGKARDIPAGKLFLGYSDVTALLEFTRVHWGWHPVHAPMPGTREFSLLPETDWDALLGIVRAFEGKGEMPALRHRLKYIGKVRPRGAIEAPLVGGNMTVWDTLVGTRYQGAARGRILYFEDVTEGWYRIDRMLQRLRVSGALDGARALVLGTWMDCNDSAMNVLASRVPEGVPFAEALRNPAQHGLPLKPLRKVQESEALLDEIFGEFSERTGVPVLKGLPAGHGPRYAPLPLGRKWCLEKSGRLSLVDRKFRAR
jgi:muramoyltetrapeptide carboxypeptidase